MNINVPGLLDAAIPKPGESNRNVQIIANNMNGPNHNDPGFLSDEFPRSPPRLYVTSEDDEFDGQTLAEWRAEGFRVDYLPMGAGGKEYKLRLDGLRRQGLGPCETFGIVAYGEAASQCLEHFHMLDNNPDFKLALLVAYYPTRIPDPKGRYPGGVQVLVHLAGDSVGVVKQSQMAGIQGKKRIRRTRIDRGVGTGCLVRMAFSAFSYPDADPGFAERDLDSYDKVAGDLAWDRSLAAARKAFRWDTNVNGVVEENMESKFFAKDEERLMKTYTTAHTPHTTFMPTLVGGIGTEEVSRFYGDFFLDSNPDSLQVTLISRTSSANRVVDELHVSFDHSQGMPWILPGIPPTHKHVEIMLVSIVTLRGGKLYHEHIYWDQASVLVQVGLLKPSMVPKKLKEQGVERLPVVGKEPAERIIEGGYDDADGEADNELLPEFWDYSDDDGDDDDNATRHDTRKHADDNDKRHDSDAEQGGYYGTDDEAQQQAQPQQQQKPQQNANGKAPGNQQQQQQKPSQKPNGKKQQQQQPSQKGKGKQVESSRGRGRAAGPQATTMEDTEDREGF
ncbi:dienelactone hydrolase [Truncatella angustata]|uniref:Dienelactone hydrolase n=1 Tax=Truncatella angustata TaxID=152316 RepID=A0A9P8RH78_9PEZI|nr:dienelactone hydrolase [Truncatella angustata]KAH6645983.1 dienelactone hydrolase [Truncatella angustata]